MEEFELWENGEFTGIQSSRATSELLNKTISTLRDLLKEAEEFQKRYNSETLRAGDGFSVINQPTVERVLPSIFVSVGSDGKGA